MKRKPPPSAPGQLPLDLRPKEACAPNVVPIAKSPHLRIAFSADESNQRDSLRESSAYQRLIAYSRKLPW